MSHVHTKCTSHATSIDKTHANRAQHSPSCNNRTNAHAHIYKLTRTLVLTLCGGLPDGNGCCSVDAELLCCCRWKASQKSAAAAYTTAMLVVLRECCVRVCCVYDAHIWVHTCVFCVCEQLCCVLWLNSNRTGMQYNYNCHIPLFTL